MTQVERAGNTLTVNSKIVMWHTVLQISHDRTPDGVAITNNPLEFDGKRHMAQVVMHKTRSHGVAVQVARYVRRRFEIEVPVSTHKANRPLEARIGSACTTAAQYEPNDRTPGWGVFQHIAATPVSRLLEECKDGHNAARTRYTVYEVRGTSPDGPVRLRGVTHRMNAVELRFRLCPPDTLKGADVVHVARCATREEAAKHGTVDHSVIEALWTKRPDPAYMRRVLRFDANGDLVWSADGTSAVRRYDFEAVVIGPHVHTRKHVEHVLRSGEWYAGRFVEARGPDVPSA